jgi:hypothetical protein
MPIAAGLLIALFAGTAAELAVVLPPALLLAIAGLALLPALSAALKAISAGPLVRGPLFAFAIALSDLTLLGLGPSFWALVLGTLTSFFLEREGLEGARVATPAWNERTPIGPRTVPHGKDLPCATSEGCWRSTRLPGKG